MLEQINPFDIVSGKVVQNKHGTFWFKACGINVDKYGEPIVKNLHRDNNLPAAKRLGGATSWWVNGRLHRTDGPAIVFPGGDRHWWLNDVQYNEKDYNEVVRKLKKRKKIAKT